jgi:hypothetical protein
MTEEKKNRTKTREPGTVTQKGGVIIEDFDEDSDEDSDAEDDDGLASKAARRRKARVDEAESVHSESLCITEAGEVGKAGEAGKAGEVGDSGAAAREPMAELKASTKKNVDVGDDTELDYYDDYTTRWEKWLKKEEEKEEEEVEPPPPPRSKKEVKMVEIPLRALPPPRQRETQKVQVDFTKLETDHLPARANRGETSAGPHTSHAAVA